MHDVGRELPDDVDDAAPVIRNDVPRKAHLNIGWHAHYTITVWPCLAHEDIAFLAFEIGMTGRCIPADLNLTRYDTGPAAAAGAGGAFIGETHAVPKAGVQERFPWSAGIADLSRFGLNLHAPSRAQILHDILVRMAGWGE
jgi:hypothetical protein